MSKFTYTETERKILKNFQQINLSMIVHPDRFDTINNAQNVIGIYDFENPYDYEEYGIYDLSKYNTYLNNVTDLELLVKEKFVVIYDKASNLKQTLTTSQIEGNNSLPVVDDPAEQFDACEVILDTTLSSDKMQQLLKFADVAKHDAIFFKNINGILTMIAAEDDLNNSIDPTLIDINSNNINENNLEDTLRISKADVRTLLDGFDYHLKIVKTSKGNFISKWTNDVISGLRYYISLTHYDED